MELHQQVEKIEEKVRNLLQQFTVLQEENRLLKRQLADEQTKVTELKNKLDESQQAVPMNGTEEKKSTKVLQNQIDHYIQEIDKCIEWLQNA